LRAAASPGAKTCRVIIRWDAAWGDVAALKRTAVHPHRALMKLASAPATPSVGRSLTLRRNAPPGGPITTGPGRIWT
jgi:hypothetical protein